jgi:hypothetical protein
MTTPLANSPATPTDAIRSDWFRFVASGLLTFNGTAAIFTVLANSELLQIPDPLFGISTRWLMLLFAGAELTVAALSLFSYRRTLSLWLMLWLTLNLIVYRLGLENTGWTHPYSYLGQWMSSLNLSPLRADAFMAAMLLFLFIGSLWQIEFQAKTAKRKELVEKFQKMSCPACGGHVRFDRRNLGQNLPCPHCRKTLTLRPPNALKMSCFFCHGHIEFPPHAIGEKMLCLHCKMDITLKESL